MKSQAIKQPCIVFDFGGVLFDWNPHYLYDRFFDGDADAVDRFLKEIGFNQWNVQMDMGYPFVDAVADLSQKFPQYEHLIRIYNEQWEETLGKPIQKTVRLLKELKQAGYPLYGLSNWSQEKFEQIRPRFEFLNCFEDILLSGVVKLAKPDPKIFLLFLQQVGRKADECLFIDDSLTNITAASQLGFKTIHYKSSEQLQQDLTQQGLLLSDCAEE